MKLTNNLETANSDWIRYYKNVANNPPRITVLKAITLFKNEDKEKDLKALDLVVVKEEISWLC